MSVGSCGPMVTFRPMNYLETNHDHRANRSPGVVTLRSKERNIFSACWKWRTLLNSSLYALWNRMFNIFCFFYLVCEAIGTAASPGLLCQPRVIVNMIVEKQMECRLAGETEVLGEKTCPSPTFVHHKIPHDQTRVWTRAAAVGSRRLTAYFLLCALYISSRCALWGGLWTYKCFYSCDWNIGLAINVCRW
jgi:hypothetical protein